MPEEKFWIWEENADGSQTAVDENGGIWEVYADYNEEKGRHDFSVEGPGPRDFAMGSPTRGAAKRRARQMSEEN